MTWIMSALTAVLLGFSVFFIGLALKMTVNGVTPMHNAVLVLMSCAFSGLVLAMTIDFWKD